MKKTLIIGATSAIAEATARLLAVEGEELFLVARNRERLDAIAADLRVRGAARVEVAALDLLEYDRHAELISKVDDALGGFDRVLIAHGTLPDQRACEQSFDRARYEFEVNALSTISLLTLIANRFEQQGSGTIAVITSVAGDRGRQSNYVYGSAKGALTLFLGGLRNRLAKCGVRVITIKPGFVDTPMTAELKKGALWASPGKVALDIRHALDSGPEILYTPWFWRWIMLVIRAIPEGIFKRLGL